MITRIIYPPLKDAFFNAIAVSSEEIILVAPYVQLGPIQMIADILSKTENIGKVKVHLITNISSSVFLTNSSDINAILGLMEKVPNVSVTGIGNLHAKIYIFDSKRLIITSGNLSLNGMFNNLEVGTEIIDIFEATQLRHKVLGYAKEGTQYEKKDILDIKYSLEKHAADHAGMIEHLQTQSTNLSRQVKKVTSKKVAVRSTRIADPNITAIISIKGTRTVPRDTDLIKPQEKPDPIKKAREVIGQKLRGQTRWDAMYGLLLAYRETHPKYWPIKGESFEDMELGDWCEIQRSVHDARQLKQQRHDLLKSVGFEFSSTRNVWEYCAQLLRDYREEFPNQWPNTKEIYNGQPLGKWCLLIRKYYKKGSLTAKQIKQLEGLGFEWDDEKAYLGLTIELLKVYRQEFPNQWPAVNELYNGYNLFFWCMKTSKYASRLPQAQMDDLHALDFPYETFYEENRPLQRKLDRRPTARPTPKMPKVSKNIQTWHKYLKGATEPTTSTT